MDRGWMEKTKLVKTLPSGRVFEIDLEELREADRKWFLRPKHGLGPSIIYDRDYPDMAGDGIVPPYLPVCVEGCKDLAKFAIESFNNDNPHIPPYSKDAMELIRATRPGSSLYRLIFSTTTISWDDVVVVVDSTTTTTFEAEVYCALGHPIPTQLPKVIWVKIRDHPPSPPEWTTGELPFAVNMC